MKRPECHNSLLKMIIIVNVKQPMTLFWQCHQFRHSSVTNSGTVTDSGTVNDTLFTVCAMVAREQIKYGVEVGGYVLKEDVSESSNLMLYKRLEGTLKLRSSFLNMCSRTV